MEWPAARPNAITARYERNEPSVLVVEDEHATPSCCTAETPTRLSLQAEGTRAAHLLVAISMTQYRFKRALRHCP